MSSLTDLPELYLPIPSCVTEPITDMNGELLEALIFHLDSACSRMALIYVERYELLEP